MGIEQNDNQEYFDTKKREKNKKEAQDFFESQKLKLHTSHLLQSLAKEISIKFGINIQEVKNLIESKTSSNLEDLQKSLWNNEAIDIWDLLRDINNAKYQIEDLSKKYRDELKKSIDQDSYEPEKHEYIVSRKIFPETVIHKIHHPKNINDNLIGAGIGLIDSSEAVILFLYWLGKWIILTPYHIYLMIVWKAKINL